MATYFIRVLLIYHMSGLRTVSMFKCCELGISVRRPSHSCFLFVPSVVLCVGVCVFRVVVSYLLRDRPYRPLIMPLKSRAISSFVSDVNNAG